MCGLCAACCRAGRARASIAAATCARPGRSAHAKGQAASPCCCWGGCIKLANAQGEGPAWQGRRSMDALGRADERRRPAPARSRAQRMSVRIIDPMPLSLPLPCVLGPGKTFQKRSVSSPAPAMEAGRGEGGRAQRGAKRAGQALHDHTHHQCTAPPPPGQHPPVTIVCPSGETAR